MGISSETECKKNGAKKMIFKRREKETGKEKKINGEKEEMKQ